MARYTQTLAEFIEDGGELPAVFEQIEGLKDAFFARYCDREIGFETPYLFQIKLAEYARLIVPLYKRKLDLLKAELDTFANGKRYDNTFEYGKTKTRLTELPIDDADAEPSSVSEGEAYTNKETRAESGDTATEKLARLSYLEGRVKNVLNELLEEFKPLFIVVYA